MTLAALARFADLTWIKGRAETRAAADYVDRLGIKTPSLRQPIRYLSGGNQQKVLMARWLLRQDYLKCSSWPSRRGASTSARRPRSTA